MSSMHRSGRRGRIVGAVAAGVALLVAGTSPARGAPPKDMPARIERLEALLATPVGIAALPGADAGLLGSATARRVEAFRIFKSLPADEQEAYERVFAAPEDEYECLLSERLPLRACYSWDDQRELAEFMLAQAEDGWDKIVDGLGFWPPWRLSEESEPEIGMDFYLGNTRSQGAAGYTAPVDHIPATAHHDCTSYIVIDDSYRPGQEMGRTIRHELCHAAQMAMDCAESASAMEATSVWLETALRDDVDAYFYWASAHFQSYPERSIAWDGPDAFYKYGSSLFLRFVHEFLGDGDVGVVPRLWEATVQYEDINEPDMLDAITDLAGERGLGFGDVVREFGEWRYFMGARDDGAHFSYGDGLAGAEVKVEGHLSVVDPDLSPQRESVAVHPLGYWFATIDLPEELPAGAELWVGGQRDSLERWSLLLWLIPEEGPPQRLETELGRRSGAPIQVPAEDLAGLREVVLMVANTREDVDWDMAWSDRRMEVEVELVRPPRIDSVAPAALRRDERQAVTIDGAGFVEASMLRVQGGGVGVLGCARQTASRLLCELTVDADATAGPRAVVVDNGPDRPGPPARLDGALQVVPPAPAQPLRLHPGQARPGDRLVLQLRGHGLQAPTTVRFDCPELRLQEPLTVSSELMYLDLQVDPDAAPRVCDLHMEDAYGGTARLHAAFTVLQGPAGHESGRAAGAEDDGCSMGDAPRGAGLWEQALQAAAWLTLRPRGRPRGVDRR